jgi:hypothetical protein
MRRGQARRGDQKVSVDHGVVGDSQSNPSTESIKDLGASLARLTVCGSSRLENLDLCPNA